VDENGSYWYAASSTDRKLHRLGGPAIEYSTGAHFWYQNGLRHRLDGPAVENADGDKFWYQNGQRHRVDGPAIEYANGTYEWWLNGIPHTEDSWRAATQPAVEMTVAEIEAALGKRIKVVK
jgi:hypothetical protein